MPSLSILMLFCCLLYKIHPISGDYTCICNNGNLPKNIFKSQTGDSDVLGYLKVGFCKANHTVTNGLWLSVLYQHQVGYIQNDSTIHILKCVGDPRKEDALTTPVPRTTAEPIISTVGRSETTDTTMLSSTSDYKESNTDNKTTTSEAVDVTIPRPYTSIVSTDIISSITEATKRPASPTSTSVVLTSTVYSGSDKTNFITTVKTMQENSSGIPHTTISNKLHNSTSVLLGK
ncbi:uncharacterized protein LOC128546040 [Mercenaria mercenaria]|uniref:uncharacterized protein LOC128546040 n=1 Tax=Mercenaria mercenaria TaxID=6596 RepID=UPI00234EB24E|nr:uncharacterized protein LOC128546040 [Mercenaria mercenaria]